MNLRVQYYTKQGRRRGSLGHDRLRCHLRSLKPGAADKGTEALDGWRSIQVQEQDLTGVRAAAGGVDIYGVGRSCIQGCFASRLSSVAFSFLKSGGELLIGQVEISREAISLSWIQSSC